MLCSFAVFKIFLAKRKEKSKKPDGVKRSGENKKVLSKKEEQTSNEVMDSQEECHPD
jgi:hypothetical protein